MSKLIVHYVKKEKFTSGYIFYMHKIMQSYRHVFIIDDKTIIKSNVGEAEIIFISHDKKILTNKDIKKVLDKCDKFIVSGVFYNTKFMPFLPNRILKKTYLHFWGGDFYDLRDKPDISCLKKKGLKTFLYRSVNILFTKTIIRKCAAVITLIEEDYDELVKITGIKKPHFRAPMPGDGFGGKRVYDTKKQTSPHLILLGNSATEANQHIEALDLLNKFSNEDIEIICPLSYGDKEYAKRVSDYGKRLFGPKFISLNKFMAKDEYFKMLARVEVAIFNNNRQQAMGNINKLFSMGCKLYLRDDTSMWRAYSRRGYSVHNINSIYVEDFDTFVSFPEEEVTKNKNVYIKQSDPSITYNAWKEVLDKK